MIQLRQLLREFEAGKLLWADPTAVPDRRRFMWDRYISRIYGDRTEPNTAEETEALNQIYMYLITMQPDRDGVFRGGVKSLPDPEGFVKDLLKLKRKFPEILDPEHDPEFSALKGKGKDMVYRAMNADVDVVLRLITQADHFLESTIVSTRDPGGHLLGIRNTNIQLQSRSAGFMSFTMGGLETAGIFLPDRREGRWPVIAAMPYASVKSRAVLSPAFLEALSGLDESEIWVLGGSIKPAVLYIQNPFADTQSTDPPANDVAIMRALQQNPNSMYYNYNLDK